MAVHIVWVVLQALSRGCKSAAFIELDPWVTKACLRPNIETCQAESTANVFTTVSKRRRGLQ